MKLIRSLIAVIGLCLFARKRESEYMKWIEEDGK